MLADPWAQVVDLWSGLQRPFGRLCSGLCGGAPRELARPEYGGCDFRDRGTVIASISTLNLTTPSGASYAVVESGTQLYCAACQFVVV